MEIEKYGFGVFAINDFISKHECIEYMSVADKIGYEKAMLQTIEGPNFIVDIRNNDRVIHDNKEIADKLYARAKDLLPQAFDEWVLTGLNERLRFYRYEGSQIFKWHKDGTYARSDHEESMLTFMVYLNDGFEGGSTQFPWDKIKPAEGMALVFPHRLLHQGSKVASGVKYVLRTDVMYACDSK